ncbi:MAG: hypothetical protein JKY94_17830 [Rhodobacteraceae bacterium]|nr:hypothetical protein [Paracoccaceae bacterium]
MATIQELRDELYSWVSGTTGRLTRHDNEDLPTSADPFCLIDINEIRPLAHDVRRVNEAFTEETLRNQCEITIDLAAYGGKDALEVATRLHASTKADQRYVNVAAILGRGRVGAIRNLTDEENGNLRRRYEFRMTGYATLPEIFEADYFDKVDIVVNETDRGEIARFTVPEQEP